MNSSLRFFFVVETLLLLFAVWQIVNNTEILIFVVFGILNIYLALRKKPRKKFQKFQLILGSLILFFSLISSPALWLMLIFAVLFIGLKGVEISGIDLTKNAFWRKKQMMMIQTEQLKSHNNERTKQQLIGNQRIGSDVYEWDDINIAIASGDTIIDLGNTLLPKDDNIVIVRKGVGRTRILVPLGIAISLEHATLFGNVYFEEEQFSLKNESIKIYSNDYDENPRRLKIITNTLLGDVEVIRV
ncbi:cell wall-active antibiotics response protein LiaF [Enterococcus sp. DIV0660C]|uniref:cell wall-active antibiotics response protein LiaF n=1 Tax=Enterococcus sp. DIV0660C TaxID=2230880 RepID=UPI001A909096|nr:cell wall-active antibiotics response protein LiaF [Enterococcus sp. DIV0660C]MBO0431568.1 cell wall-active antibiotics response protein [Enterococcus sp. DIV0660C]